MSANHECNADRHIDEEADAPGQPVGNKAAENKAEAGANSRDRGVIGEGARALGSFGEVRRQQRERRWRKDRGADALDGARAEQPGGRLRESDGERSDGKQPKADDEHAAAAENVAGARAEQQQTAERQRVGVLHPREVGVGEAEALLDFRQAGDDDRDVEHDHQVADENDPQHGGFLRWRGGTRCFVGLHGTTPFDRAAMLPPVDNS